MYEVSITLINTLTESTFGPVITAGLMVLIAITAASVLTGGSKSNDNE
jgi:hypothetical protein